jgi:hypothetical protein
MVTSRRTKRRFSGQMGVLLPVCVICEETEPSRKTKISASS